MTSFLATLVVMASNAVGMPCAAIDNYTNAAAWKKPDGVVQFARYRDLGGTLRFNRRVPPVVRMAEETLSVGAPGFKVRVACNIVTVL